MFVVPLVVSAPARTSAPPRIARPAARSAAPRWLYVWLAAGLVIWLCVPAARGGDTLGATLPFWLIGAPLLNLAWLTRARWLPRVLAARPRKARRPMAARPSAKG